MRSRRFVLAYWDSDNNCSGLSRHRDLPILGFQVLSLHSQTPTWAFVVLSNRSHNKNKCRHPGSPIFCCFRTFYHSRSTSSSLNVKTKMKVVVLRRLGLIRPPSLLIISLKKLGNSIGVDPALDLWLRTIKHHADLGFWNLRESQDPFKQKRKK